jgi:hypothetical protein
MPTNTIPKYIQVFKPLNQNEISKDQNKINELIKIFESGGIPVDENYKKQNKIAKNKIPYVISSSTINGSKAAINPNSSTGNWIYCGDCYIRNVNNKIEFGHFMAYNTEDKKIIDFWDDNKYKVSK